MQKRIKLVKNKSISHLKLPFDFFENHYQKMNAKTIKMYLYILYLCTLGDVEIENEDIAKKLNLTNNDIEKAYNELKETGLLIINEETGEEELVNPEEFYKNLEKANKSELKKETKEIIKTPEFNSTFKKQLRFIEDIFKKDLNQNEMLEIYDLINNQKVPIEVLACAIEYSLSKNIKTMNYIAKIAVNWQELGLTNYESCEKYISDEKINEEKIYTNLRRIFNLQREFFEAEKKYIDDWYFKYGKTIDDIKKALDTTVINTGKLSFPYMNSILIGNKENYNKNSEKKKNALSNFEERNYDYDDILTALRKKQNG